MKITNKMEFPDYIYNLFAHEWYSGADAPHDYSATQFCGTPTQAILQNRHRDEIETDIIDLVSKVLGVGVHYVAEIANKEHGFVVEKRQYMELDGKIISGQADLYCPKTGKIVDWKNTKATSYIYGGREPKYRTQLNINKLLFENAGLFVDELEIVEIYVDWTASKAKFDRQYPPTPVHVIRIGQNSRAETIAYMRQFIAECVALEGLKDSELPPCSPAERWERGGGWAVLQHGKSRAIRAGLESEAEAEMYRSKYTKVQDTYTERRQSTPVKCIDWCDVNKWCPFYKEYREVNN